MASVLTPRQVACLQCVADGMKNRQIADALTITEKTVKNTLAHAFIRLNADSRSHAVAIALREGIITFPGAAAVRLDALGQAVAEKIKAALMGPVERLRSQTFFVSNEAQAHDLAAWCDEDLRGKGLSAEVVAIVKSRIVVDQFAATCVTADRV